MSGRQKWLIHRVSLREKALSECSFGNWLTFSGWGNETVLDSVSVRQADSYMESWVSVAETQDRNEGIEMEYVEGFFNV